MALKQLHKKRVSFFDLKPANNTAEEIYQYDGILFTGYAVLDYGEDGQILAEEEFRDGITGGWINEYYPNGQIKRESLHMSLLYNILYREYDEDGTMVKECFLVTKESYNEYVAQYKLLD